MKSPMQKIDPATGPLSREEFKRAVDAPAGQALKLIRKHDPMWGRAEGEKIRWRATYHRKIWEIGSAFVEAVDEKEADKIANEVPADQIDWCPGAFEDEAGELIKVEPDA